MANGEQVLVFTITGIAMIFLIMFLFFITRYRQFTPDQYVMHIRNGRIRRSGLGGKLLLLPLLDEVIMIPLSLQQTLVPVSVPHACVKVVILWKVDNPNTAFNKVSWLPKSGNHAENLIINKVKTVTWNACSNMKPYSIISKRIELERAIFDGLKILTSDWGVVIESAEIQEIEETDLN